MENHPALQKYLAPDAAARSALRFEDERVPLECLHLDTACVLSETKLTTKVFYVLASSTVVLTLISQGRGYRGSDTPDETHAPYDYVLY